ncbi:MAG: hypothetical protein H7257_04005 [Taibaiella sp.]|nr:hypothetical protein [Taibaiella sp.]
MTPQPLLPPDTHEEQLAAIAGNICRQLLEFQNHIAARAAGMRFPDAKEVETMRKLIACLDKIKKIGAPPPPTKSVKIQPDPDEPILNTNPPNQSPLPLTARSGTRLEKSPPRHSQPQPSPTSSPAVTLEDFDKYAALVWNEAPADKDTTFFKGRRVSSRWLRYNLFQWCLMPYEREFINNEREYAELINDSFITTRIKAYIARNGRCSPAKAA